MKDDKQGAERSDGGVDGGIGTGGGGDGNAIVATKKKGRKKNKISGVGQHATAGRASTKGRPEWEEEGVLFEEDSKVVEKALHRVLKTLETRASQLKSGYLIIAIRYAILALYGLPPKGAGRAMATAVAEKAVADVISKDSRKNTRGRAAAAAAAAAAASATAAAAVAAAQGRQRESRRAAQRARVPMTIEQAKKQPKEFTPPSEPALSDKLRIWLQGWAGTALKTGTATDVIVAIRHGAYCLPEPLQEAYRVLENAVQQDAWRYSSDLAVVEGKLRLPTFGTCGTCATSAKRLAGKQHSRSIQAAAVGVRKEEAYEALVEARRAVSRGQQPPLPTRHQCVLNRKRVEKMARQVGKDQQIESSSRRFAADGVEAIRATSAGRVHIGSRGGDEQEMRSLASSTSIRNMSPRTSKRQLRPRAAPAQPIPQREATPIEKEKPMWSPASSTIFPDVSPTAVKHNLRRQPAPAQPTPQLEVAPLQKEQEMWSPASSTIFPDISPATGKRQLRRQPVPARPTPQRQVASVEGKQPSLKAQGGQLDQIFDQKQHHHQQHEASELEKQGHTPRPAALDIAVRSFSQASVARAGGGGAGVGRCGGGAGVFGSRGKILRFVEPQRRELNEREEVETTVPLPPHPPPPPQQQQQQGVERERGDYVPQASIGIAVCPPSPAGVGGTDEDERGDGGTDKRAVSRAACEFSVAGAAAGGDDTLDPAVSSERSFSSRAPLSSASNASIVSQTATAVGRCDDGGGVSNLSSDAMRFEGPWQRLYRKQAKVQSSPLPPHQQQQQPKPAEELEASPYSFGVAMRSSSRGSVAGADEGGADIPHGPTSMPLAAGARAGCNDTPDPDIFPERSSSSRAPLVPARNVGNRLPMSSGGGGGGLSGVPSDVMHFVEPVRSEELKAGNVVTTTETPTEQQRRQPSAMNGQSGREGPGGEDTLLVKKLRQQVQQLEKENAKLLADNSAQAKDLKAAALAVGMAIIQRYRGLPGDRHASLTASTYSMDERAKASAAFAPRATWARIAAQAGVEFCLARQAERAFKGEDLEELERGYDEEGGGGVEGRSPSWERTAGSDVGSSGSGGDTQQEYQAGDRQRETYTELENGEGLVQEGEASGVQDEMAVDDDEWVGQESEGRSVQLKANAAEAQDENRLSFDKFWESDSEEDSIQQEEDTSGIRGQDNARYGEWPSVRYSHAKGNSAYSNDGKRMEIGEINCDHETIGSKGTAGEDDTMSRPSVSGGGGSRDGSMLEEGGGASSITLSGPQDRFHFEEMSVLEDEFRFEEM